VGQAFQPACSLTKLTAGWKACPTLVQHLFWKLNAYQMAGD